MNETVHDTQADVSVGELSLEFEGLAGDGPRRSPSDLSDGEGGADHVEAGRGFMQVVVVFGFDPILA